MSQPPLYSVATWDMDAQEFTPQVGVFKAFNLTLAELRRAIRELRGMGYSAQYRRDADGTHDDNDFMVRVERTDGKPEWQIMKDWK